MSKLKDLSGLRFGKLLAQEYNPQSHKWICQCDCGKISEVNSRNLTSGKTKSCGCLKERNHVGKRFGKLTVLEKLPEGKYLCKCDCGNERITLGEQLTSGKMISCEDCGKGKRSSSIKKKVFTEGTQPSRLNDNLGKANKSGVKGVNWDKSRNKWQASIKFKGHKYNLGRFEKFDDAVKARKDAEEELFKPFLEKLDK